MNGKRKMSPSNEGMQLQTHHNVCGVKMQVTYLISNEICIMRVCFPRLRPNIQYGVTVSDMSCTNLKIRSYMFSALWLNVLLSGENDG